MLPQQKNPGKPKRRSAPRRGPTEFAGIAEFAREIGRDRTHVWRVLTGQRPDGAGIIQAWRQWRKEGRAA